MSGIPPPPPPPPLFGQKKEDLGSLCPPPPQSWQYYHASSQHQPIHQASLHNNIMHQQHPGYFYNNVQYQQVQHPLHSGYHFAHQNQPVTTQQYNYYTSPNYASAPPPPPPPRNPVAASTTNDIDNAAIHSGAQPYDPSPNKTTNGEKPKKVNPKMAQKYSGQGLKTITISGPGLRPQKFKICVGNHPEDIQKWIAERKKNFPRSSSLQKSINSSKMDVNQLETKTKRSKEVEAEEGRSNPKQQCKGAGENAASLSNLLAGYGSSSSISDDETTLKIDKSDDPANEKPTAASKETSEKPSLDTDTLQSRRRTICKYHQRGKCHHGDSCKFLHSDQAVSANGYDQRKRKRLAQSDRDKARNDHEQELQVLGLVNPSHKSRYNKGGGKTITNTSLLHKLLQRDKERERRLTLQLLRYIVDCDYLLTEKKSEEDQL
ncbi:hypothetical protein ACHAXM_010802 [Skeletonema potamos]